MQLSSEINSTISNLALCVFRVFPGRVLQHSGTWSTVAGDDNPILTKQVRAHVPVPLAPVSIRYRAAS